ncbi:hypothetical protein Ancab_039190 [Ancistrocladus abbreviatus]
MKAAQSRICMSYMLFCILRDSMCIVNDAKTVVFNRTSKWTIPSYKLMLWFHVRRWEGATSTVGSSVGMVGSGIGVGLGAIVGIVWTGLSDVGSGPSKVVRFMGRTITWLSGGSKMGWFLDFSELIPGKWRHEAVAVVYIFNPHRHFL